MRMNRVLTLGFAVLVAALSVAAPDASAQDPASVLGRLVSAGDGRPVAGAAVRLTRVGYAGEAFTVRTDAEGRFARLGVRPGLYRAAVERDGFAPLDVLDIDVHGSDRVRLRLSITPLDEAPFKRQTVRYRRPLVNTEDGTMSTRVL